MTSITPRIVVGGLVDQRGGRRDPGGRDHPVDRPELLLDPADELLDRDLVGHVADERRDGRRQVAGLGQPVGVDVDRRDLDPVGGEAAGRQPAHAAAGAGHERDAWCHPGRSYRPADPDPPKAVSMRPSASTVRSVCWLCSATSRASQNLNSRAIE